MMQSNQTKRQTISSTRLLPLESPESSPIGIERNLAWQVAPNLVVSFKYAAEGIRYAFATQRNFRIHSVMASVAVLIGLFCHLTPVEMCLIILTSSSVMVLELLNTALESVVDLTIGHSYHSLAKIAKDCAAGAVLVSAIAAVLVAALTLLPALIHKLSYY